MADIQRYVCLTGGPFQVRPDELPEKTKFVTYADHLAAVAAAEQRVEAEALRWWSPEKGYEQGQRDALALAEGLASDSMPGPNWVYLPKLRAAIKEEDSDEA